MHKYHVMMIEETLHTPAFKIKLHCITKNKTDNMQQRYSTVYK